MTFTACCTIRNSSLALCLLLVAVFATQLAYAQASSGQAVGLTPLTEARISEVNDLKDTGKLPFHIKLSFQLYTLAGKSSDQGTIEYWWAGDAGSHLEVNSPLLGMRHSLSGSDPVTGRELYLLSQLSDQVWRPAFGLASSQGQIQTRERQIGGATFNCFAETLRDAQPSTQAPQICLESKVPVIRLQISPYYTVTRNRLAMFGPVHVAMDTAIAWNHLQAISAHIDTLQSFHRGDPDIPEDLRPKQHTDDAGDISKTGKSVTTGTVIPGKKLSGPIPQFLPGSRKGGVGNSLVLGARITAAGKVTDTFAIASPDESLTSVAEQAVKQWVYQPYLLNGKAIDVTVTIVIDPE